MKIVKKIIRKGYPTSEKIYQESHSEADVKEKRRFKRGYNELKKLSKKISQKELIGTHTRYGNVKVSKKVPKKLRKEVGYHEKQEWLAEKRLKKRKS